LDNELDTTAATHVAEHLAHCAECKRHYDEMKTLAVGVKQHAPYYAAPTSLTRNLFATLPPQSTPVQNFWETLRRVSRNWIAPTFSAAALAAALVLYAAVPSNEDIWIDEAVSDHVRSLMAEHLNDVASSDKHTVKPWFTGKLDFAPPVYDFSAQGYTLLGGRLDYLQHQTAAALSYQHNKHIINTFILPTTETDSGPQSLSRRGYNIVSWRQNHMRFIAISDLNVAELTNFSQMMQKGM